jgi:branched-chain amino acid transport system ATP-binding protein
MLKVRNLEAGYGRLQVLKWLSLHISAGEIVTLIGANGAGKTTLLMTLAGILKAQSGSILLCNKEITDKPAEKIVEHGASLVPEGRQIFAPMTVKENLILGAYVPHRQKRFDEIREDLEYVFTVFPVLKSREHQVAGTLSGGEQQMLAMARSLLSKPSLLMLDEPSMGLAPLFVKEIFRIIGRMREEGRTILLVEQNARAALKIADRGYVIETGQIVLEGTAQELLNNKEVQRAYLGKEYKKIND